MRGKRRKPEGWPDDEDEKEDEGLTAAKVLATMRHRVRLEVDRGLRDEAVRAGILIAKKGIHLTSEVWYPPVALALIIVKRWQILFLKNPLHPPCRRSHFSSSTKRIEQHCLLLLTSCCSRERTRSFEISRTSLPLRSLPWKSLFRPGHSLGFWTIRY